jgi:hypothetical protein
LSPMGNILSANGSDSMSAGPDAERAVTPALPGYRIPLICAFISP